MKDRAWIGLVILMALLFGLADMGKADMTDVPLKIVMLGDSLVEWGDWSGVLGSDKASVYAGTLRLKQAQIINHGISGDTTVGVWGRLEHSLSIKPDYIILEIGINDVGMSLEPERLVERQAKIWREIVAKSPETKVLVCSLLPVKDKSFLASGYGERMNNSFIRHLNADLERAVAEDAAGGRLRYVDVHSHLVDEKWQLADELSADGLHITQEAYWRWSIPLLAIFRYDLAGD